MKKNVPIISLLSLGVFAFVSCEQPSRVVERPLGFNTTTYPPATAGVPPLRDGSNLMNDISDPSTIGMPKIDPNAGTTPGGNTISNMINGGAPSVTNTPANPNNTAGNGSNTGSVRPPVTPPVTAPKAPEIPYAWPDPSDPNVVRSPYNRELKIRITKPDGTRYSSGTVMWDPNFKNEKKQFRVP